MAIFAYKLTAYVKGTYDCSLTVSEQVGAAQQLGADAPWGTDRKR